MYNKKTCTLILIFVLCISSFLSTSNISLAAVMDGKGTEASPYLIYNILDLYKIPEKPQAHYKIMNDLDFQNAERIPMSEFKGVLDGDGHTISNIVRY